jgi:muramoyltetrapeptide carboxypeptidase LdcA involved in peptidoglycan recycling
MRYPKFLTENDTIAVVAPSFGCSFEPYISCMNAAIKYFENKGYKIVEGPNARKGEGVGISSTPENCGKELQDYYLSKDNQMLISSGGGELMCETISNVDFEAISMADPKWFMGYSDNTNFTFLLNTLCDTASIYGPNFGAFGAQPLHQSFVDAYDLFTGKTNHVEGFDRFEIQSLKTEENPLAGLNLTEKKELRLFMGAAEVNRLYEFSGRIIGGCLDCLTNLVGTRFDKVVEFNTNYKNDGIIWFLEACELNPMSIRRALWNMENAGWFKYVKGFIIGRPDMAWKQELMGMDQYNAVTGILGKYNVPIIMDADVGHLAPSIPIISGAIASVSSESGNIALDYNFN